jgi:hypothetical protein
MFERFTQQARDVVSAALREARGPLDVEDLALALLDTPVAAELLPGTSRADLARELAATRRNGGLSGADVAALGELGIDVAQVLDAVERGWGPGAFTRPGSTRRRTARATPAARAVLARSLAECRDRGDREIGATHLLLAVLAERGPVADSLAALGVDAVEVRRRLARRAAS